MTQADGEWNQEIQYWMDPSAPAQSMKAFCVNKMILGGRYQESLNTGSFNGMPFEGRSLTGWDNARKIFVSTWIDNMGTGILYMEGPWDNASKTINLLCVIAIATLPDRTLFNSTNLHQIGKAETQLK